MLVERSSQDSFPHHGIDRGLSGAPPPPPLSPFLPYRTPRGFCSQVLLILPLRPFPVAKKKHVQYPLPRTTAAHDPKELVNLAPSRCRASYESHPF